MKIGIFSDSHYSSQKVTCGNRYNSLSLKKLKKAAAYFRKERCQLVLCLGDLADTEPSPWVRRHRLRQIARLFRRNRLPFVSLMGNHDAFSMTPEEFYRILGRESRPEDRVVEGRQLLFLDACYTREGSHYQPGGGDWTDTCYPFVEELRHRLEAATAPVYVFLHQNIDPTVRENHCLHNSAEIRAILEESGKVRTVFQGHYHPGSRTRHNGIDYVTLPALCEQEEAWFVFDL